MGLDQLRSSREGALSPQPRASEATDSLSLYLTSVTTAKAAGAPSLAQRPLPLNTLRNTPCNSWGHATSESHLPALSSSTQRLFSRSGRPSNLRSSSRLPGAGTAALGTGTHSPRTAAALQWPVPAPPGRPRPPNLKRAEHLPPRPPAAKLPGPAAASSPGPGGLPSHGPPACRPEPGLTWCPPRRGGAGGRRQRVGAGEGSESRRPEEVGGAGQPAGRGRARGRGGAGLDKEVRRPVHPHPVLVAPSGWVPGRVLGSPTPALYL